MKHPSEAWYEELRKTLLDEIEGAEPTDGSEAVFSAARHMAGKLEGGPSPKYRRDMAVAEADTQIDSMIQQELLQVDAGNKLSLTQAGKDFLRAAAA